MRESGQNNYKKMKKPLIATLIIFFLLVLAFIYFFTEIGRKPPQTRENPFITGYIYLISENQILVAEGFEGEEFTGDTDKLRGNAIWLAMDEKIEIIDSEKEKLEFQDLKIGSRVKVWTIGPIMESYPLQGTALKIEVIKKEKIEEDFENYQSFLLGISFSYPMSAKISYKEEGIEIAYFGENSQISQVTDGFTFLIKAKDLEEKTIEEIAREEIKEKIEGFYFISNLEKKEVNQKDFFTFKTKLDSGKEETYSIFEKNDKVIIVSYFIPDPNDKGYEDLVDQIFETIEFDKNLIAEEIDCFVGGCSGELCTDNPEAISTCELLPGMECLKEGMTCESVKGECTWVLSEKAAQCFLTVKNQYGEGVMQSRIGNLFLKAEEVLK